MKPENLLIKIFEDLDGQKYGKKSNMQWKQMEQQSPVLDTVIYGFNRETVQQLREFLRI